jgi:hypothetical protein
MPEPFAAPAIGAPLRSTAPSLGALVFYGILGGLFNHNLWGNQGPGGAMQVSGQRAPCPCPTISQSTRMCSPLRRPARRPRRPAPRKAKVDEGDSHPGKTGKAPRADDAKNPATPAPAEAGQPGPITASRTATSIPGHPAADGIEWTNRRRRATAISPAASAGTWIRSTPRWPEVGTSGKWIRAPRKGTRLSGFQIGRDGRNPAICNSTAPAAAPRSIAPACAASSALTPLEPFHRHIIKVRGFYYCEYYDCTLLFESAQRHRTPAPRFRSRAFPLRSRKDCSSHEGIFPLLPLFCFLAVFLALPASRAGLGPHRHQPGQHRIRIAAADFKPVGARSPDPALKAVFDATLYNDLGNAGIFDLVSKSLAPQAMPGSPQEISLPQWSAAPSNAAMVAFGARCHNGGRIVSTAGSSTPQHRQSAGARQAVQRGSPARIWRAPSRTDSPTRSSPARRRHQRHRRNQNLLRQHPHRHQKRSGPWTTTAKISTHHPSGQHFLSPRISPDNSRLAFASLGTMDGRDPHVLSRTGTHGALSGRRRRAEATQSPAWSSDGSKIAFSSSRSGDPEIWVADASGGNLHSDHHVQRAQRFAPPWNPRTNAQLAWVSGRTGLPQIYTMDRTAPTCSA